MKTIINIGLVLAVMLLLCLFPMSYGYYELVRFVAMIVFALFAFNFYKQKQVVLFVVAVLLAILFQPFAKVALGRTFWNIIDVAIAISLIAYWFVNKKVLGNEK